MNTKTKGDLTEIRLLYEFTKLGYNVLMPFGDNCRYDFVIEKDGQFQRIQCKTGRLRNGCVQFHTCSSQYHRGNGKQSYRGDVEFFATFCAEIDECFIIPVDEVGERQASLRVNAPKKNQFNIRWAKDYTFESFLDSSTGRVQNC